MEDEVISLFLVATFAEGPNCAAIYEIKLGGGVGSGGGGGCESATIISPLVKAFRCEARRDYSPVGCDISGSHMCLMASYTTSSMRESRFIQFQPLLFDTNTKKLSDLPCPNATKPFPNVIAVHGRGFFVLAGGTESPSLDINSPCFERLDPPLYKKWGSSSLPEFRLDKKLFKIVSGYAVIDDCILISVCNCYSDSLRNQTEFHYYKVGSSMKEWVVVNKDPRDRVLYYPFGGKAEYVDGYVYTFTNEYHLLIAYHVRFSSHGIIQSLGVPLNIAGLDFIDIPVLYWNPTWSVGCIVHLGGRIFCLMITCFNLEINPSNVQYVSILTVKVSPDMKLSTLNSHLCALNIEGLGRATLTSLCFDSQRSKDWSEYFEVLNVHKHLKPAGNIDPPKLESVLKDSEPAATKNEVESVDGFLRLLGLEKYSILFKDEEIDMPILVHMTDDELKSIGLPKGPRKKILLALDYEY